MSLESVFKLSLIMNMIDNLSGPMAGVASKVGANVSKLDAASQTFGSMAKAGAAMQETGSQIVNAVLAPVEATFETRRALGELASLGVQDLEAVENAARSFSDQWAGTSKADFISAAYDIKSGIASLSDEGVAEFKDFFDGVRAQRFVGLFGVPGAADTQNVKRVEHSPYCFELLLAVVSHDCILWLFAAKLRKNLSTVSSGAVSEDVRCRR